MKKKNTWGGKRPNQKGRPRLAEGESKEAKKVKVSLSPLLRDLSGGKEVRECAEWGMINGFKKLCIEEAPNIKRGDKVTLRIEASDTFKNIPARVTTEPILDITGTWVVGLIFFGQKKSVYPVSMLKWKKA